jgi:hypothetical protein
MQGKINATNLSAPSLQALRAERHQETKGSSFWNKWSNLSTGQKWGRALAWVILPVGIGFQIKANLWQAKAAAPRPRHTTLKQSDESVNGISLSSQTTYGSAHRTLLKNLISEHEDIKKPTLSIGSNGDSFSGLADAFEKDVMRDAEVYLRSSEGHDATINKNTSKAGTVLRDFFKTEFQNSGERAEPWAVLTSKYANQITNLALNSSNTEASGFRCTKGPTNSQMRYALYMENGGNSALLEASVVGDIENISAPEGENVAKGKDNNIDWEKSRMEETLLLRLELGPPESFEVISAQTKHNLVLKQPSENSEVEDNAPVHKSVDGQMISSFRAASLLYNLSQGRPSDDYPKLNQFMAEQRKKESPDLKAFKDAFNMLDTNEQEQEQKQKLIAELVSLIKDKAPASYSSQIEQDSELGQLLSANLEALKLQENLRAIQGMKNILNAAGIHSVNDLGKIDNRKNAAASITLLQKNIINQNFLGVGNNIFTNSYDQTELLDDHIPSQQRSDFYRPLLQESYKKTASDAIQQKQVELDNGELQQDDFDVFVSRQNQNLDMMLRDNLQFDLDNLNDPDKRALLRNYIKTAKSNNLTATEAMQVLRGLPAYHKADGDQVKNQLRKVLNNQIIPERQLDNLESLFPPMSS